MRKYGRMGSILASFTAVFVVIAAGSPWTGWMLDAHADVGGTGVTSRLVAEAPARPDTSHLRISGQPDRSSQSRQAAISDPSASITYTLTLQPGWNAVYLPLDPEDADLEAFGTRIPFLSVWTWDRSSMITAPPDPASLTPGQPGWLAYFPPGSPSAEQTNLRSLAGGRAYLIFLAGQQTVDWELTGQPVLPRAQWLADSFNLVGLHVDPAVAPTFKSYFGSARAHAGQRIYRLDLQGRWQAVSITDRIAPLRAYWVFAAGPSTFAGPLKLTLEQGAALDFGSSLGELTLRIRNETDAARQVSLGQPGGSTYLSFWGKTGAEEGWLDRLPPATLRPGVEASFRIGIRRDRLTQDGVTSYRGLLEISDGQGVRFSLPLSAENAGLNPAGLWVGTAMIDKVNDPTGEESVDTPVPTASTFPLRLILHVNATGKVKLLQEVTLLWKQGVEGPDPQDPTKKVVKVPGRQVLVTRDDLLSQFSGSILSNGVPVGRRISSAAFSFQDPVGLAGDFGSGRLVADPIVIPFTDSLNPFVHKYHPEHDNLDARFEKPLEEGQESYTIVRQLELIFGPPGPRQDRVGGTYRETITGVYKNPLHIEGTFELQRVSTVDRLNDQP